MNTRRIAAHPSLVDSSIRKAVSRTAKFVAETVAHLGHTFPDELITVHDVFDMRGRVAIWVVAGEGRLVAAAHTIDLAEVEWPWRPDRVIGALPPGRLTVDALCDAALVDLDPS